MGVKKKEKKEQYLYNGQVHLIRDTRHIYTANGEWRPSVTGITSSSNKDNLIPWAARMAVEHMAERLQPGVALDEVELDEMLQEALTAHERKRDRAATIGSAVHDWIDAYIKLKIKGEEIDLKYPINQMARKSVISFLKWEKENTVIWQASEQMVLSREYGFAGTLDNKCVLNGNPGIGDFKTGSGIWEQSFYQLAAYWYAEMEESGIDYPASFVLHIPADGGIVHPYYMTKDIFEIAWKGFMGLYETYKASKIVKKTLKEMWIESQERQEKLQLDI